MCYDDAGRALRPSGVCWRVCRRSAQQHKPSWRVSTASWAALKPKPKSWKTCARCHSAAKVCTFGSVYSEPWMVMLCMRLMDVHEQLALLYACISGRKGRRVIVSKASLLTGTKADAGKDDSQSLFSYGCVCCTCILSHTRLYAAPSVQNCCQYITSWLQTSDILQTICSSILHIAA